MYFTYNTHMLCYVTLGIVFPFLIFPKVLMTSFEKR